MSSGAYGGDLQEIQRLNLKLQSISVSYEQEMAAAAARCPSNLDAGDYIFSLTLGILGTLLDTSDQLTAFLNEVHQMASSGSVQADNPVQWCLAKALHHQGDWMDQVPTDQLNRKGRPISAFVTRAARESGGVWSTGSVGLSGPHRIFWGHDLFSVRGDNPFSLCIREYGALRGILQAVRHLVADTCSHQGLPLPFSSCFDYIEVAGDASGEAVEKMRSHLLDFCQRYSQECLGKRQAPFNNEVFNHLFSVHLQDALSTGLVAAGTAAYCGARNITDETRRVQMRVIGYMAAAFGSALLGAAAHGGVPSINAPRSSP